MTVEYDCEGCGVHVYAFGISERPSHCFCAGCAFLDEFVTDRVEMMEMYKHMNRDRADD